MAVAALACASLVQLPPSGAQTPDARPAGAEAIGAFERDRALRHVRVLARRIGVRVRGRPGERRGARYFAARMRDLGYDVAVREFDVDGRTSRNVVATWPGALRYPVVIGAHVDTVARSPGANDNASGVAILLEIARLIADRPPARFVKLVAFGSEEYGTDGRHHVGSQVFVNRLDARARRRTPGMVSVDMVADGRPLVVGTTGLAPAIVARTAVRRIRKAGIRARFETTCDCSDNGPFERAGIPGAFLWSGREPNYHLPSDTVRNMSPRDLHRSGRAVRAFVVALSERMIRRFRDR
ncbi:MAG TPA: M28 family peptidase [Actinomycetota bacterium]|nr:M28 family peptidase [Actinomycetota bacterium]